jgi:fused signal recognition particle receptor
MSFFGKLKSKLFKSSAKLEEGLDAIVQDDVAPEEAPANSVSVQEAQPEALRAHDRVEDGPLAQKRAQAAPSEEAAEPSASVPTVGSRALRSGHPAA